MSLLSATSLEQPCSSGLVKCTDAYDNSDTEERRKDNRFQCQANTGDKWDKWSKTISDLLLNHIPLSHRASRLDQITLGGLN